jgi:hypothetical protein
MKADDKYHSEIRDCSRTGLSYVVNFYYDADATPPDVLHDGHGIVLDEDDYQTLQDSLTHAEEENTDEAVELRLRVDMMQRLDDQALRSWPRYYDVWMSLQKARKEQWNGADSTDHNALMAAVNADYDYLRGWYTSDWWSAACVRTTATVSSQPSQTSGTIAENGWRSTAVQYTTSSRCPSLDKLQVYWYNVC